MTRRFSPSSINTRFFFATLIPLLIITLLFAGYTITSRKTDLDNNIQLMGQTRAALASTEAGLALISKDSETLIQQSKGILNLKGTLGILFLDTEQQPVYVSSGFPTPEGELLEAIHTRTVGDQVFYYAMPVKLAGIDILDYEDEFSGGQERETAGWVVVALDITEQHEKFTAIIATTLLFALIGFLVSMLVAYLTGRTIIEPIKSLTEIISRIRQGNLSVRAEPSSTDELDILASGINRMAETVQDMTENLENRITTATSKLHKTLEDLQAKNAELKKATEQTERASQAKSDFLARMSHELRTPLTSIQGFARLLNESAINDIDKQHCQVIDQAAAQLLMLIDDILDFSKLQSNTVVLENDPFNLIECIEQVLSLFTQAAHEKGLELLLDVDPAMPLFRRGDAKRIRQIINNLVSNALKFTHSGSVAVNVRESGKQPEAVEICVKDTGIGISDSNRSLLFRAFSQADTSISRQFGGTGLGLAIIKNLIDLMGGSVVFNSELGRGTEFVVTLPLNKITESKTDADYNLPTLIYHQSEAAFTAISHLLTRLGCPSTSAFSNDYPDNHYPVIVHYLAPTVHIEHDFPKQLLESKAAAPHSQFIVITPVTNLHNLLSNDELNQLQPAYFVPNPPSLATITRVLERKSTPLDTQLSASSKPLLDNLNILIAEDNQFTCLLLETLIDQYGGTFSTATNGVEAVKICHNEPFDIILIDMHMPEMNGIEAIRQIRRGKRANVHTPIIALTADLLQQEEDDLTKAGANEMLLKPFNENYLLERIRALTGNTAAIKQQLTTLQSLVPNQLFLEELITLAGNTKSAIAAEQWDTASDLVHQMLGVTGVFKVEQLEEQVLALHRASKQQDYQQMESILAGIVDLLADAEVSNA